MNIYFALFVGIVAYVIFNLILVDISFLLPGSMPIVTDVAFLLGILIDIIFVIYQPFSGLKDLSNSEGVTKFCCPNCKKVWYLTESGRLCD